MLPVALAETLTVMVKVPDAPGFSVPMGQEMGYRYQESLINEHLATLRAFLDRCEGADKKAA